MTERLRIDVWSDIACPWCYVGKRQLEAALDQFPESQRVQITWRAFELDGSAPKVREPVDYAERLGRKYGTTAEQAQAMIDRMTGVARGVGLDFRFDRIRPGNTFDAHRLLHLAALRGVQDAVKERFLRGYLTEGEAIGDGSTLIRLSREAGLDADEVASVLGSDRYADDVRADEAEANALGISGVPFFVIGSYGVSGAQSPAVLLDVLAKAWSERGDGAELPEGAACGPDGC
jgi:predicted DsbA family dithiol-disulfide isomerase